jgi:small GTP-binding protein
MIFNVVFVNLASRRKIASADYWSYRLSRAQLNRYLSNLADLTKKSERLKYKPTEIDSFKLFSRECGEDCAIVFVTDRHESDDNIVSRINRVARVLRGLIGKKSSAYIKRNFWRIIDPFVNSQFVIALVGESGVGKTSLLHLLLGEQPPEDHFPTIALNTEAIPNIRFANYDIVMLDFAGQAQSRKLWNFKGTDMIFLVTDSTLRNLVASKGILTDILQEYPNLSVFVFANKQDLPNALDPSAIGKVMGIDVQSMVAVDLAFRNELLGSLVHLLCNHFGLEVPDTSPDTLLRFSPD